MSSPLKVFIVGMPGAGKTTAGKLLANRLKLPFFDLDAEIEENLGERISTIFESHGEDAFRKKENEIFSDLNSQDSSFVMATGGGTPCFYGSMSEMNSSGITIYLQASVEVLASRTKGNSNRPLLKGDHYKRLEQLFLTRQKCYEEAQYEIPVSDSNPDDLAEEIYQITV